MLICLNILSEIAEGGHFQFSQIRMLGDWEKKETKYEKKKPTSFYPLFLNNSNSGRFKAHSYSGGIVSQWLAVNLFQAPR